VAFEGGAAEKLAIIKDFQTDPIRNELLHADLLEVTADKPIHVTVPVSLEGDSKGVKEGGILQHLTRELLVECLPGNIPEHIIVEVAQLVIGASVHVRDLKLPEGVKALTESDKVIVTITAPISAEKLEQMLSVEAASEVKEPEVLKAKKEAEEEKK
jgi:large subunit ribosomal protein L25